MPYTPFASQGTQLDVKITSTFTPIPGVEGLSGPTGTKPQIEVTALSDTAAKFIAGLPDYGDVSFSLFWDPAEATHQKLMTSYQTSNSVDDFQITCSDAGAAVIVFSGTDEKSGVAGKTEIPRWQWQHLVLVRDGKVVRAYLNGGLELETSAPCDPFTSLGECFFGGRSDNDSKWEGRIDEVAVFNRALSAEDLAKLLAK